MKDQLEAAIAAAVQELFNHDVQVELTRPDEQFGDYATNVALQLAKPLSRPPREVADALAAKLQETLPEQISGVTVAGPGFLNLTLTDAALLTAANTDAARSLEG